MAGESFSINPKSYLNFQGVFFYINIHKVLGEVKLFLSLKGFVMVVVPCEMSEKNIKEGEV